MAYSFERLPKGLSIPPLILCMSFVIIATWNRRSSNTGRGGISVLSCRLERIPQPLSHLLLRNTLPSIGTYHLCHPSSLTEPVSVCLALAPELLSRYLTTSTSYIYPQTTIMSHTSSPLDMGSVFGASLYGGAAADTMAESGLDNDGDDQTPSEPKGVSGMPPSMIHSYQIAQDTDVGPVESDTRLAGHISDASASSHQSTHKRQNAQEPLTPVGRHHSRPHNTIKVTATVAAIPNNREPVAAMVETTIQPVLPAKPTEAAQGSPYGSERSKGSTAFDVTASSATSSCQSPSPRQSLDKHLLAAGKGKSSNIEPPSGQEMCQDQVSAPGSPGHRKGLDIEVFMKHAMAEHVRDVGIDVDLEEHPRPSKAEIQEYKENQKEALRLTPSDRKDRKYNHFLDVGEDVDEKLAIAEKQLAQMLSEEKFKNLDLAPKVYLRYSCCSTDCKCRPCWSRFPSCREEEAALASFSLRVLLRHMPNATGTGWKTSEIVIRGQDMKRALKRVFEGYLGFDPRRMGEDD